MPRALLRVCDSRRKAPMCVSPRGVVCPCARNRCQQGVREADTVVRDLDHVRVDRGAEQLRRIGVQRTGEQVDRTVAGEGSQAKRVERSRWQERKSSRDELLQRGRDRERLAGRDRNGAPIERPPELEREERIPARCVDDLEQRRPGQCEPQTLAEQRLHRVHVESAELDVRQALALERRSESERVLLCVRSRRDENSHGLIAKPTERELEHGTRRRVKPVDIIERDKHGLFTRQFPKDAEESSRDGARLWIGLRLDEEERALERASLRTWQAGQHLGDARFEEIGERRMRELRLRRHRLRR